MGKAVVPLFVNVKTATEWGTRPTTAKFVRTEYSTSKSLAILSATVRIKEKICKNYFQNKRKLLVVTFLYFIFFLNKRATFLIEKRRQCARDKMPTSCGKNVLRYCPRYVLLHDRTRLNHQTGQTECRKVNVRVAFTPKN